MRRVCSSDEGDIIYAYIAPPPHFCKRLLLSAPGIIFDRRYIEYGRAPLQLFAPVSGRRRAKGGGGAYTGEIMQYYDRLDGRILQKCGMYRQTSSQLKESRLIGLCGVGFYTEGRHTGRGGNETEGSLRCI